MNPRVLLLASMAAVLATKAEREDTPPSRSDPHPLRVREEHFWSDARVSRRDHLPPTCDAPRYDTIGSYSSRGTYDVTLRRFATSADRDAFNAAAAKRERKAAARLARGRA